MVETYSSEGGTGEDTIRKEQRTERKEPGWRQLDKWPKANEVAVWRQLDENISIILEQSLCGQVETKLNRIRNILYEECRSRFGVGLVTGEQKGIKHKGRREREIEQLVKRHRHPRKQWRKTSKEEKEGLKPLWEEVKKNLVNLRRVERIRKRRRQKQKERSDFFKNLFKHARQLLEEKRNSKLEVTPVKVDLPKLSEVAELVRKAKAASAPGPNWVSYKLYKYCPGEPPESGVEEQIHPFRVATSCHSVHPEGNKLYHH